jgi:hypothetical protein
MTPIYILWRWQAQFLQHTPKIHPLGGIAQQTDELRCILDQGVSELYRSILAALFTGEKHPDNENNVCNYNSKLVGSGSGWMRWGFVA